MITDEWLKMYYLEKELSKSTIDEWDNFMKKLFYWEESNKNFDLELKKVKEKIEKIDKLYIDL